jgi:Domain of unknown function (DUF4185)
MLIRGFIVILLNGILPVLLFGQAVAISISGSAEMVVRLTGPEAINDTLKYRIYGTDLGHVFDYNGRLYYVFGDTFWKDKTEWRSNVMAVSSDFKFADGINFDYFITDKESEQDSPAAIELIAEQEGDVTAIPTNGVAVGKRMYLYYMSVNEWGAPGKWKTSYSGAASSDDGGWNWEKLDNLKWVGDSNFAQVAIAKAADGEAYRTNPYIEKNDIFLMGIPSGRFGPVKLMKVPGEGIEEKDAYQYYAGTGSAGGPIWSDKKKDAVEIIQAPVGECSVMYNEYLERWIISYLNEGSHNLEIREAPTPWGPWSGAVKLVDHLEIPGLYGAFMHPAMVEEEGRIVYFTMSIWEPYSVYLMKVVLSR